MRVICFILFFLLSSVPGEAAHKEFIVMSCRWESGMFSVFNDMLGLIKCYDQGKYEGIEIDFGQIGLYYDPSHGPNWWSYYCKPICYGKKKHVRYVIGDAPHTRPSEIEKHTSRREAYRLIKKYITFRPNIVKKIDAFTNDHFKNKFVIGVHYRGTDMRKEVPARVVSYEKVAEAVKHQLNKIKHDNVCIFVAADEAAFVEYMVRIFGNKVVCNTDVPRSRDELAIHKNTRDPYQNGKSAVEDCLLLARCKCLIRTSRSNLSLWATFLNLKMTVQELKP